MHTFDAESLCISSCVFLGNHLEGPRHNNIISKGGAVASFGRRDQAGKGTAVSIHQCHFIKNMVQVYAHMAVVVKNATMHYTERHLLQTSQAF